MLSFRLGCERHLCTHLTFYVLRFTHHGGRMPKVGRNDPCPCGSGKKYKHCHLPIEEAAQAEQLRLRRAVDTLLPKMIAAAQARATIVPEAFSRFWNGKYSLDQLEALDNLEGRGAERFLTWFAFDY